MFTRSLILNLFAVLLSTLLTEHITEAFVRGSTNVVQRTTIATNSAVTSLNAVAKKNAAAKKKKASTVKVKKEKVESVRKKEFVSKMAEELDITKADAEDSLICALELITSTLVDGKKVVFPGFGTFEPRPRNARKGRNPKTGDEIDIAASIGAGFSPAKALKDKLNGRE